MSLIFTYWLYSDSCISVQSISLQISPHLSSESHSNCHHYPKNRTLTANIGKQTEKHFRLFTKTITLGISKMYSF